MTAFSTAFSPAFDVSSPITGSEELKARLDAALEPSSLFAWTEWGIPTLTGLKADPRVPAIMVAYGGATVVGDFRHAAQVS